MIFYNITNISYIIMILYNITNILYITMIFYNITNTLVKNSGKKQDDRKTQTRDHMITG